MFGVKYLPRCLTTIVCSLVLCAATVAQDQDDLQLVAGLRERRMFKHAEYACHQALSGFQQDGVQNRNEVAFIIELIRLRADQARFTSRDKRESFWEAAKQEAKTFLEANPKNLLVQLQSVLVDLERVDLVQQELQFGVASEADRQHALKLSQSVRGELRNLEEEISRRLQVARNTIAEQDDTLTSRELESLHRNVNFQLAEAGFQCAQLYEKDEKLNRDVALTEVNQKLNDLQRVNESGSALWWQTQLALARSYRQLGDLEAAQAALDRVSADDLRSQRRKWHESILVEQAELLLAGDLIEKLDRDLAARLLVAIDRQPLVSARLDLLALRIVAGLFASCDKETQRIELREQAKRRTDLMLRQHGPWWGSRAQQLWFEMTQDPGQGTASTELFTQLVQQGQTEINASRFDSAVVAFERASEIAKASGDMSAWRSCQVGAVQGLEKLGRHDQAAKKSIQTAYEDAQHSASASLHLRGCWNLGRNASKSEERHKEFLNALKEHLSRWPESTTCHQAKVWLGRLQLADDEFEVAAKTLLGVPKSSPHRSEAVRLAAAALEKNPGSDSESILYVLIGEYPKDVNVLLAYGRVGAHLATTKQPQKVKQSLFFWRDLARRLKSGSDAWLEAKYNVARLLMTAGEKDKARQLLEYVSALPPGWKKSPMAAQFEKLRTEIGRPKTNNDLNR